MDDGTYTMMPKFQRLTLLLLGRIILHVVPVPTKGKVVRDRVDQQVEELWASFSRPVCKGRI